MTLGNRGCFNEIPAATHLEQVSLSLDIDCLPVVLFNAPLSVRYKLASTVMFYSWISLRMRMVNVTNIWRVVVDPLRMAPGARLMRVNVSFLKAECGRSVLEPLTRMVTWGARLVLQGCFGMICNLLEIGLGSSLIGKDALMIKRSPPTMLKCPLTVTGVPLLNLLMEGIREFIRDQEGQEAKRTMNVCWLRGETKSTMCECW